MEKIKTDYKQQTWKTYKVKLLQDAQMVWSVTNKQNGSYIIDNNHDNIDHNEAEIF